MAEALFYSIGLLLYSAAQPPGHNFPNATPHKRFWGILRDMLGTVTYCGARRTAIIAVSTAAEVNYNGAVSRRECHQHRSAGEVQPPLIRSAPSVVDTDPCWGPYHVLLGCVYVLKVQTTTTSAYELYVPAAVLQLQRSRLHAYQFAGPGLSSLSFSLLPH